jgi:hypothetical protein
VTDTYLATTEAEAQLIADELFAQFLAHKQATDPDAVVNGEVLYRNPKTGLLDPTKPRTTAWGKPGAAVQGFVFPVPQHEAYSLVVGTLVTNRSNPWPIGAGEDAEPLPAWVQPVGGHDAYPFGAWVEHNGNSYCSEVEANVWEPEPSSTLWRISPDPGPLPWVQPSGSSDAYKIGAKVTHTVAGRTETLWESNIDANVYEPGDDGTSDRWWKPIEDAAGEILPWEQPMPGTANAPYEEGQKVTHEGSTWENTVPLNVWPPSGPGAYGWTEVV